MAANLLTDPRTAEASDRSPHAAMPSLVWVGPRERELGWLYDRLATTCENVCPLDWQVLQQHGSRPLEQLLERGVQRVVFACESRWDYPASQIDWLGTQWPEVPFAVATSSWWEGAGRTGVGSGTSVGSTGQGLFLPWYRWWDGWWPWLASLSGNWFTPAVTTVPFLDAQFAGRLSAQPIISERFQRILLICNQGELVFAWKELLRGERVVTLRDAPSPEFERSVGEVAWCLIDDSVLNTLPHQDRNLQWSRLVRRCRDALPTSKIVCAMLQPDWSLWMKLIAEGANELLAKPSTGSGLHLMLRGGDGRVC